MAQVIEELEIKPEILSALRQLAARGANVRELVGCLQAKLSMDDAALLPVLWYFMKAFHLPLDRVLPLREWLGTNDDQEIDRLILPAIQKTKSKWLT